MTNYYPYIINICVALILFWMAFTDFTEYKIRNNVLLLLLILFFLQFAASGRWHDIYVNGIFGIVVAAGLFYAYLQQQMGGGDFKLLAISFLWTGPRYAIPFVILLLFFIGIHYAFAKLGWVEAKSTPAGLKIPLAPAVAGALICVLVALSVLPTAT